MNSIIKYFLLYFTPIVYWGFYHYVGFSPTYAVYIEMIYSALLFVYLFPTIFQKRYKRSSYSWYMKGIICIVLVSMLMPIIFWDQSVLLTYRATVSQFVFLYYFILLKYKVSPKEIVTIILVFSTLYVLLWAIALLNAPFPVFSEEEELDNTRGAFRIIINSLDIILLLYCYSLCWIRQRSRRLLSVIVFVVCALLIISSLTRSIMASIIVVTVIYILLESSFKYKVLIVLLLLIGYPAINTWLKNNDTVNAILELNEDQLSDFNEDNSSTRITEYRIGFLEYKRNPITLVLGSGFAHGNSDYGRYEKRLHDLYKYDRSDAGYPAIFVSYGLVGLFLFIGLFIKALFDKSGGGGFNQYKMYIIIIAAVNVLQDATTWYAIATCMTVYMLETERKKASALIKHKRKHKRNQERLPINHHCFKMNIIQKVYYRCRLLFLRRTNLLEYNKLTYYYTLGRRLDIKNPKTLDEKIVFMSFFTDTTLWSKCADKVLVRDYVKEHGYGYMLNEVYGVYEHPQEINYEKLPSEFVMKTNHASGTNIIVKNKEDLDINKTNKQLEKWLKMDYSKVSGDPHYSSIKPLIVIEKLLKDNSSYNSNTSLADFKFFCINGTPVAVEMMTDRFNHTHKRRFYDMDWKPKDEWMLEGYPIAELTEKPAPFEEMKQAATALSKDFCFVRVDFYVIDDKPVFGELTFTPGVTECSPLFLEEQGARLIYG